MSESLRNQIDRIIQRNAYFAHPENILLCMLTDKRQHIRDFALRSILKARNATEKGESINGKNLQNSKT